MMLRLGSSTAGALGWIASVAIHGVAALVATGVISPVPVSEWISEALSSKEREEFPDPADAPTPDDEADLTPVPVEPEPLKVRLGIDESDATDTETWLGFASASPEHGGIPMGFEQAQLRRSSGDGGLSPARPSDGALTPTSPGAGGEGQAASATLVQHDAASEHDRADSSPVEPAVFLAPSATPSITLARDARETPPINAPGSAASTGGARGASPSGAQTPAPGTSAPPQAVDETAKPKDEPVDLSKQGAGGEREPGVASDRDADAASIRNAILASPGRPLAAKGLRIQTVRPQFSAYALATANPDDVVVRIWFNAQGRVAKAELLQSSGRADVDRPVLDAVYNWRATGEPLKVLLNSDPDARIELVFRVTLRR